MCLHPSSAMCLGRGKDSEMEKLLQPQLELSVSITLRRTQLLALSDETYIPMTIPCLVVCVGILS